MDLQPGQCQGPAVEKDRLAGSDVRSLPSSLRPDNAGLGLEGVTLALVALFTSLGIGAGILICER